MKTNPYLEKINIPNVVTAQDVDLFLEATVKNLNIELSEEELEYIKSVTGGEIPKSFPHSFSDRTNYLKGFIHSLDQQCGFYAKITKEFAKSLASYVGPDSTILDPLAGQGYFAKALRAEGVPVIASDNKTGYVSSNPAIESLDAIESLKKYGNDVTHLLISWAPNNEEVDYKLAKEVKESFPHIEIICITEDQGGCTGSDEFFDYVEDEDNFFENYVEVEYNTYGTLFDSVRFYSA